MVGARVLLAAAIVALGGDASAQSGLDPEWIAFARAGAANSNQQCFTKDNVSVAGGHLLLTTRPQPAECSSIDLAPARYRYTSGFVAMRRFAYLYGTLEVRARFAGGPNTGAWPLIWMEDVSCQASDPTGTNDDCNGEEIDVAEILHGDFTSVNQQIHVRNYSKDDGCTARAADVSKAFHVYRLTWTEGRLVFAIDGVSTCTIAARHVPSRPMYVKITTYVGSYGGPIDEASLPWTTAVDYVKVTQGSFVVFHDDFDPATTVISRPAALPARAVSRPALHAGRAIAVAIAGVAVAVAAWKIRRGRRRPR